jgi:hypothetical protein
MNKGFSLTLLVVALIMLQYAVYAIGVQSASNTDPLSTLNSEFLKLYAEARNYEVNNCGPIIVVSSGKVILITDKKRAQAEYMPVEYRVLKTVDHMTLAVFVALKYSAGRNLNSVDLAHLKALQQSAQSGQEELSYFNLSHGTLVRQKVLLQNAIAFIKAVQTKSKVSDKELDDFVRTQTPALMDNAKEAVAMELSGLDKRIQSWKQTMTPAQWNKVHVVICDEHMPRQDERYMQYFLKFFGEKQEGQRVIYQEGNFDANKALQLLGTHLLDTKIANAFFGNADRMHHDLLFEAARSYLNQHASSIHN